jgi:hypothetical protein
LIHHHATTTTQEIRGTKETVSWRIGAKIRYRGIWCARRHLRATQRSTSMTRSTGRATGALLPRRIEPVSSQ